MKIGVVLQARTSSTRLPRKVLMELPFGSGITALQQIIRRLRRARTINQIILATTNEKSDDAIVNVAKKERIKYFRGSLTDVLERYYLAAKENNLDVVVRITGDCPCMDPKIVDAVVAKHLKTKSDLTSNVVERSYPDGLDVEVFNFNVLETIYRQAMQKDEREHVTAYVYKHRADFKISNLKAAPKLFAPDRRITLDTPQDYALLCIVFGALYRKDKFFSADAVMKFFAKHPWLDRVNTPCTN